MIALATGIKRQNHNKMMSAGDMRALKSTFLADSAKMYEYTHKDLGEKWWKEAVEKFPLIGKNNIEMIVYGFAIRDRIKTYTEQALITILGKIYVSSKQSVKLGDIEKDIVRYYRMVLS